MCAAGTICKAGACIDACAGVMCPGNAPCSLGVCSTPMSGGDNSGAGQSSIGFGGSGTGIDFPSTAGSTTGTGDATGAGHGVASKAGGCGCRMADGPTSLPTRLAWLGSAVALAFAARRRRAARKSVN
jgi:MYXO-CTERM domain-containing protein